MAITKTTVSIFDGQSLGAGNADTVSNWADTSDAYDAMVCLKLTNGANAPANAASIGVSVGVDEGNNGSTIVSYSFGGRYSNGNSANGTQSWTVQLPVSTEYVQIYAGGNTNEAVTAEAWLVKTTSLVP